MWYSWKEAGNYRPGLLEEFTKRILAGDTVTVGIDYYAMNISRQLIPDDISRLYGAYLWNGGVLRLQMVGDSGSIQMSVLQ